ncbi:MAG TPA: RidA family protein [Candidatus Limnocylindria bacterium]|nr:RidA family protein [Candidatus Limnocylindria bacterium]
MSTTVRQRVETGGAPAAIGPYSQAIRVGELVFTAGQVGIDPSTGELQEGVAAQADRALQNLRAVLDAAGLSMDRVVKTTVFLADLADFETMNGVYASHFSQPYPARSTVAVKGLPKGALVEIEVVAVAADGG